MDTQIDLKFIPFDSVVGGETCEHLINFNFSHYSIKHEQRIKYVLRVVLLLEEWDKYVVCSDKIPYEPE